LPAHRVKQAAINDKEDKAVFHSRNKDKYSQVIC
jgi:hypothetical protein